MRTERRILFACFTGAAIGAIVALQLHYFWWAGILVGALAGYLSFSIKEVLRAVAHAWVNLSGHRLTATKFRTSIVGALKCASILTCIIFCAASAIAIAIGGLMFLVSPPEPATAWVAESATSGVTPIPGLFWMITGSGMALLAGVILTVVLRSPDRKRAILGVLGCIAATPLFLPVTLGFIFISAVVPRSFRLAVKVAKHAFILIHSEARLLCMTDALLGALIGYFCGNALIGGAAGAALGWLNYRLVSVRWLKLAKA
jgi:hypothetical protein